MGKSGGDAAIKVFLRCRPQDDDAPNDFLSISLADSTLEVSIPEDHDVAPLVGADNERFRESTFKFHGILDEDATQDDVFELLAHDCVQSIAEGVNGTIFAYGQSGSGKTFSISGSPESFVADVDGQGGGGGGDAEHDDNRGLVPRALEELFELAKELQQTSDATLADIVGQIEGDDDNDAAAIVPGMKISVSFLEIVNDTGRDLLVPATPPRTRSGSRSQTPPPTRTRSGSGGSAVLSEDGDATAGDDSLAATGQNVEMAASRSRPRAGSGASVGRSRARSGSGASVGRSRPRSGSVGSSGRATRSRRNTGSKLRVGAAALLHKVDDIADSRRRSGLPAPSMAQLKRQLLSAGFSEAQFRDARGAIVAHLKASVIDAVSTEQAADVHSFIRSLVHSFIRSFVHSFIRSFVHSFVRSFVRVVSSSLRA